MEKRIFNLIIVDESGSMYSIRQQAFSGMNETLESIRNMQDRYPESEQRVTLLTFDSEHIKWHHDNCLAKDAGNLKWDEYNPSACTPLYDAIGMAVTKMQTQVKEGDSVLVTIITDGYENSSREWTLKKVQALIEKLKKEHWTFALIGTDNLDVESMARDMSIGNHLAFCADKEGTEIMFKRAECARMRFMENCTLSNCDIEDGSLFSED